jgi:hypothetical protein
MVPSVGQWMTVDLVENKNDGVEGNCDVVWIE